MERVRRIDGTLRRLFEVMAGLEVVDPEGRSAEELAVEKDEVQAKIAKLQGRKEDKEFFIEQAERGRRLLKMARSFRGMSEKARWN